MIDIALEAEKHGAAAPDSPTRRFLLKHERLIDAQTAQLGRQRWRDFILTGLGVCALAAAGLLVWDASQAGGVVVEPFAAPPELVERGLSGPVLATQMLDKLRGMQAQTDSTRAASTYADNWGDEIEIEIPSTGVSIGEARRYLRAWLGDQTRLSGEVFRLADGRLAVTTRVGATPATRSEGAEDELDALLQKGAEAIYAETQPYRYSVWLVRENRIDDARAVLQRLVAGTDKNEQLWGYYGLGNLAETLAEKEFYYGVALRKNPRFAPARFNLAQAVGGFGQEERGYQELGRFLADAGSARREFEPGWAADMLNEAEASRAALVGDLGRAGELSETGVDLAVASFKSAALVRAALTMAEGHDPAAARRILQANGLSTPQAMARLQAQFGPTVEVESAFARAIGDWEAVRARLADVLAATGDHERGPYQADPTALTRTVLALAYAKLGRIAEARATIAPTDLDCAPCVRARGLVEAYAGDARAADHWLSESVRITPSLPAAHNDWAEAYLVRGDAAGALAQARLAVRKGPNWAEPRKLWGDALILQNKPAEAVRQYHDAVKLAPHWGALHLALGRAQAAAGQAQAARESFRTAARLELNAADRAAVAPLLR
ncbi:hypothetical protein [Caulobacter sp. 17J65-9]|uniref:hypothetical protein n=1 Tax=Caulobacter sp. 17J65-9 TaxID=2709382 RepID=UPI0013C6C377|nr:hypothetical protein [Caulobacter sp. 17J65-9]NEX91942.1 hypothetical protein [Caulobacter sp. 17J65-9]